IEILSMLGFNFKVVSHRFKEPKIRNHPSPEKFVEQVAIKKAKSIAKKWKNKVIISADTVVVLNNEIIGKPEDEADAVKILTKLAGTRHKVYTGVCLYYPAKKILVSSVESSVVYTRKLTFNQIKKLASKHLDKAGAYAVQQKNDKFVKKIVGDYYNVVGFPIKLFLKLYCQLYNKLLTKDKIL
ncbi:MAG: Maf family nucleotide pyrophosphatase, partial [Endomicrobia bacterium]|nr:Maf family nucleotide pyrophosphatase [Endomicrobiia bacterium]